ncbi:hypothetical protein AWB71_03290 [Caballeronia peredens]|nr:hypothetical protein AWB71_03290 [Caballeronia peredens]
MTTVTERFVSIGMEALAVRHLELSFVAEIARGTLSSDERIDWEAILIDRREHLAKKIDEAMTAMNMTPDATLESIYAEWQRRAKR